MSADAALTPSPARTRAVATKSSFYLAMRVLAPERREAMYAIYAFCRAVDDIADEAGDRLLRANQLEAWRQDLDDLYAGRIRARCAYLAEPVRRFGLARADFDAVIDGMAMDVEQDICAPDWATLDLYCDRVASAVGRLSVRVFGLAGPPDGRAASADLPRPSHLLAHHLGRALQLTNILRDLDEDAARGRLYLPREALIEAGVMAFSPAAVLSHPGLPEACAKVADRAREYYAEAERVMAGLGKHEIKAPYLMSVAYGSILDRLAARGFAAPRAPVRASRLKILLSCLRYAFS